MRFRTASILLSLLVGLAVSLLVSCPALADPPIVLTLTSDSDVIPADGHSQANIAVEAWVDQSHYSGPLQVALRSTLGDLDPTNVNLINGEAWVHLRAGAATGATVITATVIGNTRQVILPGPLTLAFVPPGYQYQAAPDTRFVDVKADYVAYSVDYQRIVALQRAQFHYRRYRISADSLVLDAPSMELRAESLSKDPVVVRGPAGEVKARKLFLNFRTNVGIALIDDPNGLIALRTFNPDKMQLNVIPGTLPPGTFAQETIAGSSFVVRGRRMQLYPGVELHAAGASIQIGGKTVMMLPYYRLSLNPYSPTGDQYLTYDTYSGLGINLPIYYMLNDSEMGSVRITHEEKAGYFGASGQAGWGLNIEQDYGQNASSLGSSLTTGGQLLLSRVTSPGWGLSWRHNQRFGRVGLLNGYFYSPDHQTGTGNLNLYYPVHGYGLSLSTFGNHEPATDSVNSLLALDLPQHTFLKRRMTLNLSTSMDYQYLSTSLNSVNAHTSQWVPGAGANFYFAPWMLNHTTTLTPSFSTRYQIPSSGGYATANSGITLNHPLGVTGGVSLTYNWSYSGSSGLLQSYSRQVVSSYFYKQFGNRLRMSASPSYDLSFHSLFSLAAMAYAVTPNWTVDGLAQFSEGGLSAYNDWQIGLSHPLLGRNLRLFYQASTHRIQFEFTAGQLGF